MSGPGCLTRYKQSRRTRYGPHGPGISACGSFSTLDTLYFLRHGHLVCSTHTTQQMDFLHPTRSMSTWLTWKLLRAVHSGLGACAAPSDCAGTDSGYGSWSMMRVLLRSCMETTIMTTNLTNWFLGFMVMHDDSGLDGIGIIRSRAASGHACLTNMTSSHLLRHLCWEPILGYWNGHGGIRDHSHHEVVVCDGFLMA